MGNSDLSLERIFTERERERENGRSFLRGADAAKWMMMLMMVVIIFLSFFSFLAFSSFEREREREKLKEKEGGKYQ